MRFLERTGNGSFNKGKLEHMTPNMTNVLTDRRRPRLQPGIQPQPRAFCIFCFSDVVCETSDGVIYCLECNRTAKPVVPQGPAKPPEKSQARQKQRRATRALS